MNIETMLESNSRLAAGAQLSMRMLDHPSTTPESIVGLDSSASKAILDAAQPEIGATARVVIALVGM